MQIDVRDLACPGPVIELRRLLEDGESMISMLVADDFARSNVTRFAQSRGATVECESAESGYSLTIRAEDTPGIQVPAGKRAIVCEMPESGLEVEGRRLPTVVQVAASTMGQGEDELGAVLMRSFIKTQSEMTTRPDVIMFYNTGVTLCCVDSPVLDALRLLEAEGTEIIACGTCLNYLELSDQLAVGRVTDMLEIATRLVNAGRVVRP